MYLLPKKIDPFTVKREELFAKLLKSNYKGVSITEYKRFKWEENLKKISKNIDLGKELRCLLAALSIVGVKNGIYIISSVEGQGSFNCSISKAEMQICEIAARLAEKDKNNKIYLKAVIGTDFLTATVDKKVILREKIIPTKGGSFTLAKDFIIDRLSPVNLAFTGE